MSDIEDSASDSDDDDASAISDDEIQCLLEDHADHLALPAIFQFEHPYLFGPYPASEAGSDVLSILSDSMNWDSDDFSDTSELNSELQWLLTNQAPHHSDNEDGNMSDVSDAHNYNNRSQSLGDHRQYTTLFSLYAPPSRSSYAPTVDLPHTRHTLRRRGRGWQRWMPSVNAEGRIWRLIVDASRLDRFSSGRI